jgi:hypothetical protein
MTVKYFYVIPILPFTYSKKSTYETEIFAPLYSGYKQLGPHFDLRKRALWRHKIKRQTF